QNPRKAQQVILDFSRYLQSNFTAIAREDTIPFTKELEHTKAYLAVEQARYQGQLFVKFDTPNTFFRIPALTLQPIVENAVKHGVDPDLEPLYVTVTTEDTDKGTRITVEDTGPGYAPSAGDAPHFALDNIRERLKTMCGGTLDIEPREAGGTKVTVFVPRPGS
ncbi:MAG: histidine kinase, partial [Lachnospiraceae bacterium]|nr:histidine kinase [Lachnospiraceae bacterium]